MYKLQIGWSEIDITPDKKASLAGQFAERISEYVEKPIVATAMAVDNGADQMVLVSVDLVGVSYNLVAAVREVLAKNDAGLDPMKVVFSAIHTHTAPGYPRHQTSQAVLAAAGGIDNLRATLEQFLQPGQKYVEKVNVSSNPDIVSGQEYFEFVTQRLAQVTLDAWNAREEASFSNAFGRAVVGMCRRVGYNDGSAQMWGDANTAVFEALEGGNDSGIELMYVFNKEKKLTGVVANLACPAQCVQHRLFVSPDFWGEVKVLLRGYFG